MSLLPSKSDTSAVEQSAPRVVGVDSEDADELLDALSSTTARHILSELHEEPAPPSQLADRVDTSLQNVQYHLGNLDDAGVIEVVDTVYSQKGREMDVYAPADRPLVIFAGDDDQTGTIRSALRRLLGGVGILVVGSLAVQALVDELPGLSTGGAGGAGGGAGESGDGDQTGAAATTETTDAEPAAEDMATPTERDGGGTAADGPGEDTAGDTGTTDAAPPETTTESSDVGIFNGGEETTATAASETTKLTTETATATTDATTETTRLTAERIGDATANATTTATAAPTTETTAMAADAVGTTSAGAGIPPGLLFFAGGAVVLVALVAFQYAESASGG